MKSCQNTFANLTKAPRSWSTKFRKEQTGKMHLTSSGGAMFRLIAKKSHRGLPCKMSTIFLDSFYPLPPLPALCMCWVTTHNLTLYMELL